MVLLKVYHLKNFPFPGCIEVTELIMSLCTLGLRDKRQKPKKSQLTFFSFKLQQKVAGADEKGQGWAPLLIGIVSNTVFFAFDHR